MSETAKLFKIVDRIFDCQNTRSLKESAFTIKPDLKPYTSHNDPRFQVKSLIQHGNHFYLQVYFFLKYLWYE